MHITLYAYFMSTKCAVLFIHNAFDRTTLTVLLSNPLQSLCCSSARFALCHFSWLIPMLLKIFVWIFIVALIIRHKVTISPTPPQLHIRKCSRTNRWQRLCSHKRDKQKENQPKIRWGRYGEFGGARRRLEWCMPKYENESKRYLSFFPHISDSLFYCRYRASLSFVIPFYRYCNIRFMPNMCHCNVRLGSVNL